MGALARLEHGPGILPVYDVGDEEGLLYLVMPLVTGGTLKDRLERGAGQPWPPRQALPLVQQVLDGLEFAHERGFIHRDVKPSNILLEGSGSTSPTSGSPSCSRRARTRLCWPPSPAWP